ncbi:hypothetical protein [Chryseobacterium sp. MP_3.2]|uniref:hypothetical protein n=1 Tax=Chryseobacterium sp. MP_3.2 TaxID=3071712 RepID=UPI002DF84963|nr:hypothetical protein [Chryseobacterium sp. MP_3.2]
MSNFFAKIGILMGKYGLKCLAGLADFTDLLYHRSTKFLLLLGAFYYLFTSV